MILKKTGASNFLWGSFVAFFIVLVTLLWYLSELLPEESRKLLAVVLSILTITAVVISTVAVINTSAKHTSRRSIRSARSALYILSKSKTG